MPACCITSGVKVGAETAYLDEYSNSRSNEHLFCYKITITNESDQKVKLLSRHWVIIDSNAKREEVKGPGVVGKQPELAPGESHSYFSFCNLETDFGTMEGSYQMIDEAGKEFNIAIPKFFLAHNLFEFEINRFRRGQIVFNALDDYRAVVVDYDMYFLNDEKLYERYPTKPPKDKPWYYVLIDNQNTVGYVSEEHLEASVNLGEINHPLMEFFFDGFDGEKYIRNRKTWQDLRIQ